MLRAGFLASAELAIYDVLKEFIALLLKNDNNSVLVHIITAFIASIFSCLVSCPFDMVRSRIMNQQINANGQPVLYSSTLDCFVKSIKNEGFMVLFSGYWAFLLRLAPNTVLTFVCIEFFRKVL